MDIFLYEEGDLILNCIPIDIYFSTIVCRNLPTLGPDPEQLNRPGVDARARHCPARYLPTYGGFRSARQPSQSSDLTSSNLADTSSFDHGQIDVMSLIDN
jgi:hypothetical protein